MVESPPPLVVLLGSGLEDSPFAFPPHLHFDPVPGYEPKQVCVTMVTLTVESGESH